MNKILRIGWNKFLPVYILFLSFCAASGFGSQAKGQSGCDSLSGAVFIKEYHATLSECVSGKKRSSLVLRLDRFRNWLDSTQRGCSTVVQSVEERYQSMTDTATWDIDTTSLSFVGKPESPVRIVMYVSLSCPLCKRVYQGIRNAVYDGTLKGKAVLAVKPFSSNNLDVALLAAAKFGKQDELMLSLADVRVRISQDIIFGKMEKLGVRKKEFQKKWESDALKMSAVRSQLERVRNGAIIAPTIFINGRRYKSYKDVRWIIDAVEYAYDLSVKKR